MHLKKLSSKRSQCILFIFSVPIISHPPFLPQFSISFPVSFPYALHLKRDETLTCGTRESLTYGIGESLTPFEVVGTAKNGMNFEAFRMGRLAVIWVSSALHQRLKTRCFYLKIGIVA